MIMQMNLRHRVSTMKLSPSKPLLPLFEAIVNAFQSFDQVGDEPDKKIRVFAERDTVLEDSPSFQSPSPMRLCR